jgi:hypothetical protein
MGAVFKQFSVSAVVAILLLAGCLEKTKAPVADESKTARPPAGPPQPVTAKTAFWLMYTPARHWSTDIQIIRVTPREVPGFKNDAGKAAMWEATFASPTLHQYRVYSYSIASSPPDIFKGVSAGLRVPWNGVTRDAMPVELTSFNVDSDAAYQAAAEDGAAWLKKNPDKPLSAFALGNTSRFQAPVWYLMWGDKKSGYVAYVDANNGKVLKQK